MSEHRRTGLDAHAQWLDFAHARMVELDAGLPFSAAELRGFFDDPWLSGEAAEPGAAEPLVAWVGPRLVTVDGIGGDRRWSEQLEKLQAGHANLYVGGFTAGLALVLAPFAGVLGGAEILLRHELGVVQDHLDGLDRAGLLSPADRARTGWHRALRTTHEDEDGLLADLEADLFELTAVTPDQVRAFWVDGELTAAMKAALTARIDRDPRGEALVTASVGRQRFSASDRFQKSVASVVFAGSDPQAWQRRWERMFWLAWPLLEPQHLVDALSVTEEQLGRRVKNWQPGRLQGFRDAFAALSGATGLYADAHAALAGAGADLAPLAETVASDRTDPDASRLPQAFCWALMAGIGDRRDDPQWWSDTVVSLAGRHQRSDGPVLAELGRPFGAPLVADRALLESTLGRLPEKRLGLVWDTFALAEPCLADPALYGTVAKFEGAAGLTIPAEIAEKYPQAWLRHEKKCFAATGDFDDPGIRTPEAKAWYREILPGVTRDHTRRKVRLAVASSLTEPEVVELIEREFPTGYPDHRVFELLSDFDLLIGLLGSTNGEVAERAASRLEDLSRHDENGESVPDPDRWPRFLELSKRHADVFARLSLYGVEGELDRWALLWGNVTERANRVRIADALLDCLRDGRHPREAGALANELMAQDREPFIEAADEYGEGEAQVLAAALAQTGGVMIELVPRMCLKHLGQSTWFGDVRAPLDAGPLNRALETCPQAFADLDEKAQIKLLGYLTDTGLVAAGPDVVTLLEGSKAKPLSAIAAAMLAGRSVAALDDAGLLGSSARSLRYTLHRGLALNPAPEVLDLVRERLDDKANDAYVRGLMLDRLESAGMDVSADDRWAAMTLDELHAEAAKIKVPKAVAQVWNAEMAALFAELGESVGQMALVAISTGGGDRMPRVARQIVERLAPARRQDLALEATSIWIAHNGTDKVAWLMQLLPLYGEERCADALTRAVKSWNKSRKAKANQATRWMATIAGNYAPAQIKTIYENTKYSESIVRTARDALRDLAEARGMDVGDLMDQLVPDFGMTSEGLELDVGTRRYLVKVMPDLSLRVLNPDTGKTTKTLPKARADEDADLRGLAENRFKALRKGLRPLSTSQAKKLGSAVLTAKSWGAAVWTKLYLEHPILRLLGQAILWTGLDDAGRASVRFRPTEDGTLIDLEDEPVALEGVSALRITHPVELDEPTRDAWKGHFTDYEIDSPIGQWGLNTTPPATDDVGEDGQLTCKQGFVVPRGSFSSLLERYGYAKGATEDGGRIYEHTWRSGSGLTVQLSHTAMSAWFEESESVAIDHFTVWAAADDGGGNRRLAVDEIPGALLAGIVQQAQELAAKGSGFSAGWRSL